MPRRKLHVPGAPDPRNARDALISEHLDLAKRVARRVARKLPSYMDLDDMVSAANMGLVDAASRFEPSLGKTFEAFATSRIRGAILDAIRTTDTMSRDMRRLQKYLAAKTQELAQHLGHYPTHQEMATGIGVSLAELGAMKVKAQAGANVLGYDDAFPYGGGGKGPTFLDVTPDDTAIDALVALLRREVADDLTDAIRDLPKQMQTVLSLYYSDELKLRQIAQVMGFTESRACQILGDGIRQLRTMYRKHPGEA